MHLTVSATPCTDFNLFVFVLYPIFLDDSLIYSETFNI